MRCTKTHGLIRPKLLKFDAILSMTCGRRANGPLIHRGCTKSPARGFRDIPSATLVGVPKGLRQPLELSLHNEATRAAIVFGSKLKVALHFSGNPGEFDRSMQHHLKDLLFKDGVSPAH